MVYRQAVIKAIFSLKPLSLRSPLTIEIFFFCLAQVIISRPGPAFVLQMHMSDYTISSNNHHTGDATYAQRN